MAIKCLNINFKSRTGIPSGLRPGQKHCGRDCKSRPACGNPVRPAARAKTLRTGLQIPSGRFIIHNSQFTGDNL
ncbi:MAG: hypothetical protein DRI57_02395 [Deltaproteobacteria bacterium]|nr:MAG: hypothetical protein DRI57_02395 [Deltaproteobacteria bacterium]